MPCHDIAWKFINDASTSLTPGWTGRDKQYVVLKWKRGPRSAFRCFVHERRLELVGLFARQSTRGIVF